VDFLLSLTLFGSQEGRIYKYVDVLGFLDLSREVFDEIFSL
jgi:hypothetical protein